MDGKEIFIKKIEGQVNILQMLSLDRLKILNNYYDELIKENRKEIEKLKSQI